MQNIWNKLKKASKTGQDKKVWYLLLRVFRMLLPKFNFWRGDRTLGYVSTIIWDFPNIFFIPKVLILMLFSNSWGNSCTKFAILDILFRFTCGWSSLYWNIVKFQIVWTRLSENFLFDLYTSSDDWNFWKKCSFVSKNLVLSKNYQ